VATCAMKKEEGWLATMGTDTGRVASADLIVIECAAYFFDKTGKSKQAELMGGGCARC